MYDSGTGETLDCFNELDVLDRSVTHRNKTYSFIFVMCILYSVLSWYFMCSICCSPRNTFKGEGGGDLVGPENAQQGTYSLFSSTPWSVQISSAGDSKSKTILLSLSVSEKGHFHFLSVLLGCCLFLHLYSIYWNKSQNTMSGRQVWHEYIISWNILAVKNILQKKSLKKSNL